ncbi:MAG TPA: type II toxin-antitoxin system HicB family antitoxin [Coriobacteriia bacterium]|nr:type II toxin-antitoxin system HicB family antitoxin [Coriobacteriia bacterium]
MAKTNISMPDALLEEVDERARKAGKTRSGFIQEAASHYITRLKADEAAAARSERIGRAVEAMAETAKLIPPGESGVDLIRRSRDLPREWMRRENDDE